MYIYIISSEIYIYSLGFYTIEEKKKNYENMKYGRKNRYRKSGYFVILGVYSIIKSKKRKVLRLRTTEI